MSMPQELKEEIVDGCVEWLDLDEEWAEEEYKQFDNDIDKRILENIK